MNIIEALKSGRRFRRRRWIESGHLPSTYWTPANNISTLNLRTEDLLADDWEVEEKTATITKSQLESACHNAAGNAHPSVGPVEFVSFIIELQKELGFEL